MNRIAEAAQRAVTLATIDLCRQALQTQAKLLSDAARELSKPGVDPYALHDVVESLGRVPPELSVVCEALEPLAEKRPEPIIEEGAESG